MDWEETVTVSDVMTTDEVAEELGVTVGYVSRLCKTGRLRAVKRQGVWLVDRDSVVRWRRTKRGRGRPSPSPSPSPEPEPEQLDLDLNE